MPHVGLHCTSRPRATSAEPPANNRYGRAPARALHSRAGAHAGCQVATAELRANVLAAYVAGGRAADVPAVMAAMKFGPRDSFEIAFNAACALLGAGDAPAAEQQLLLAQRLGVHSALTLTPPCIRATLHCDPACQCACAGHAHAACAFSALMAMDRGGNSSGGRPAHCATRHTPSVANITSWGARCRGEQALGRLRGLASGTAA